MQDVLEDPRPPIEQADVDRNVAVIRSQLDKATIEAARAKGQVMTLEQAIAYALEGDPNFKRADDAEAGIPE